MSIKHFGSFVSVGRCFGLVLVVTSSMTAGCSGLAAAPVGDTKVAQRTSLPSTTDEAAPKPRQLRVLRVGKPPLKQIRFECEPGATATVEVITESSSLNWGLGAEAREQQEVIWAELQSTVTEVSGDVISDVTEVKRATRLNDRPAHMFAEAETELGQVRGLATLRSTSQRGKSEAAPTPTSWHPLQAVRSRLRQIEGALRRSTVEFPEQEIGVGACWQIEEVKVQDPYRSVSIIEFRLVGLAPNEATVRVWSHYRSESIQPNAPAQRSSDRGFLGSLEQTLQGSVRLRLDHPLPISGNLRSEFSATIFLDESRHSGAELSMCTADVVHLILPRSRKSAAPPAKVP